MAGSSSPQRATILHTLVRRRLALLGVLLAACAGSPNHLGLYAPLSRDQMFTEIEQKVAELGYTVAQNNRAAGVLIVEKPVAEAAEGTKEEINIRVFSEPSSTMTKVEIVTARVLPGPAGGEPRRVAASSRTGADANAILGLFMKARR
jgi:hypothetical protein